MNSRDFCFWLQGFFEISASNLEDKGPAINAEQSKIIQNHLAMVFVHEIDPSMGGQSHQNKLNETHSPDKTINNPGYEYSTHDVIYRC